MRLSIAFFGIPRGYRITAAPIQRYLKSLAGQFDVTVRYHLYKLDQVVNVRSKENFEMPADAYDWLGKYEGTLETLGADTQTEVDALLSACEDIYADDKRSLRNLLLQLRSLKQVTLLVKSLQPDVVAFLRPDLLYQRFPSPAEILAAARYSKLCLIPSWQWWGGLNDRFSLCGRESYLDYGCRLDQVKAFLAEEDPRLMGEWLLHFALRRGRARVRSLDIRASRVRQEDRVWEENFDDKATLGIGRRPALNHLAAKLPYWLPWPLL